MVSKNITVELQHAFFIIYYLFLKHIYYKHMHISDMNMVYNVQTSY